MLLTPPGVYPDSSSPAGGNLSLTTLMKHLEKLTLLAVTTVYAGYFIRQAVRTRAERLFRLAAGESPYERVHPRPLRTKSA